MLCGCSSETFEADVQNFMNSGPASSITSMFVPKDYFGQDTSVGDEMNEPQGNTQDYLLQDYNIKEVEDIALDTLEEFDLSGPEYQGITETPTMEQTGQQTVTETKETILLSTYYSSANSNAVKYYVPKSGDKLAIIWDAIKDLEVTKYVLDGKDPAEVTQNTAKYVPALLLEASKRAFDGPPSGGTLTLSDCYVFKQTMAQLQTDDAVLPGGCVMPTDGYEIESGVVQAVSKALEDKKYNVILSDSNLDFLSRSAKAETSEADLHIVIMTENDLHKREVQITLKTGNASLEIARGIATNCNTNLKSDLGLSNDINVRDVATYTSTSMTNADGTTTTTPGDDDTYPILNWSKVPTVMVIVGSNRHAESVTLLKSGAIQNKFAESIAKAVDDEFGKEN